MARQSRYESLCVLLATVGSPRTFLATRRSTLVFCVNLAHVSDLTKTFREAGIDARYLYAQTPALERQALVAGFKSGAFPVLVNCGAFLQILANGSVIMSERAAILTEGADIPNIDCIIVAKPTRSRNVFAQMVRLTLGMKQLLTVPSR